MKILNKQQILINLYQYMVASRESDLIETELVNSGEANFLASSKGHEGSVILFPFLQKSDWLHCHYRDKALMMARGITNEMFFYSALVKAESHSNGRQMVSHMSAPEHNILSIVGPVGDNALQATGVAHVIKSQTDNPIVLCGFGDGASQQGEILEAIAEAKRNVLPVLFFIHNNNLAISTRTKGKTFFSFPNGNNATSFYDIPITYIDGINPLEQYDKIETIISQMRQDREPQIIVFNVDRLDNHSNADDQKLYRDTKEILLSKTYDPLNTSYNYLLAHGVSSDKLKQLKHETQLAVRKSLDIARLGHEPTPTFVAEKPLPLELQATAPEYRGDFQATKRLTMLEAMQSVFKAQLQNDADVCILGQDIEDGKGDVFGITRGLSTAFPGRVTNSALTESTIVGVAGGMALAGKKPVAFIQFADFMPLAYNQIFSELSTMYWRSNGNWQCPVIVFAACGGYRPGLGPFHSQTNEATYAHIPGIDVYMPSNASDAAGMLNAAFKSGRPSVFLYPKKLLNNGSISDTTSIDVHKQLVPVGKARITRSGSDITLVGWGNTVALCHLVADTLETIGIEADIIDIRTIKPYDLATILSSVEKTKNLIVTHEDNITCGVGGDIIASVVEKVTKPIKARRVARSDTYTPCNFANQLEVLPSYEKILLVCGELLNLDVKFVVNTDTDNTLYNVEVIGASPSDESVLINKLHIKIGHEVKVGDILVDIEASKSAGEILSPCTGIVEEILVQENERALVGDSLLKIRLQSGTTKINTQTKKLHISKKSNVVQNVAHSTTQMVLQPVGMSIPLFKTGSRKVSTTEIVTNFPEYTADDIIQRTGVVERYWLADNESIVAVAAQIAHEALLKNNLTLGDINSIICTTCTPETYNSPSMACLVLAELYKIYGEHSIQAYDINAACSGYLYALQNGKDYLQIRPNERVLLITAESLSKRINMHNFDTAFLFGDAATATILYGGNYLTQSKLTIDQINLSAIAEDGSILSIPTNPKIGINLQGKKLFTVAVKTMALAIHKCCQKSGVELTDIDVIVPHQANQRILNAVEHRLKLPIGFIYSNIAKYGNTSSCTIPIGLSEILPTVKSNELIGLCAFGGGFTAGAAILTML